MTNPSEYKVTPFERAGVWVSTPPDVTVSFTEITPTPDMMARQANFQPIRVLGNLKFTSTTDPQKRQFTFNPPARLQVIYRPDDASAASRAGRPLTFAWWNGKRWVPFPPGKTLLQGVGVADGGGVGLFDIPQLDDPAIGWGS